MIREVSHAHSKHDALRMIITNDHEITRHPTIMRCTKAANATCTMDGEPLEGTLPAKQTKFVVAWAALHEDELIANWEIAREHGELFRTGPLR